ncbi:MAG: hypothetical protein QXZ68_05520 [Candidatus Bathyarchaeia archaeon]
MSISDEMAKKVKRIIAAYGKKPMERSNPIYLNELEKDVDTLIYDEAARIYEMETGEKPPAEIPQEYKDKAMVEILKRWQETLKPLTEILEKTAPPLKIEPPKCPRHNVPLKKMGVNLWRCPYGDYQIFGFYEG